MENNIEVNPPWMLNPNEIVWQEDYERALYVVQRILESDYCLRIKEAKIVAYLKEKIGESNREHYIATEVFTSDIYLDQKTVDFMAHKLVNSWLHGYKRVT